VLVVPAWTRRSRPIRKLNNKAKVSVNAAHAIAARLALPALPASMDAMVTMDSQANPEIVAPQLPTAAVMTAAVKNNAHAMHHPVMEDPKDPEVPTDRPETLDQPVPMVNQAALDPLAHPVQLATQEMQALQDPQAHPAKRPQAAPDHPVQPDPMVNQALPARLVNPADLAKMAAPAVQALQEMLVPQATLAKLAVQVALETLAAMALQAVANTAHRLVWLQVIKRRRRAKFSGNTEDRKNAKVPSVSIDFFPKCISASFVFTSQF